MEDLNLWLGNRWAERSVQALKKHGFDAHFFTNKESARDFVLNLISGYNSFGFGGSHTVRSLGLVEKLKSMGKTIYDHWKDGIDKDEDLEIRLKQGRCDCFLSSANAISMTGEIINVDGIGNRVNAMTFGPKKVVIIAGVNKITPDIQSAINRVKNIAGPMRAKSLSMNTPCAETGICTDCNSPHRICRVTVILHRKPMLTDISVILINEKLGY